MELYEKLDTILKDKLNVEQGFKDKKQEQKENEKEVKVSTKMEIVEGTEEVRKEKKSTKMEVIKTSKNKSPAQVIPLRRKSERIRKRKAKEV